MVGEPSRKLATKLASRRSPHPDSCRRNELVGIGVHCALHRDPAKRSRVGRRCSVELERRPRPLQPRLRAAAARERARRRHACRAARSGLRAGRVVVQRHRIVVGTEHGSERPVLDDRRRHCGSVAGRAGPRSRVRHLHGRARQRARGGTGRGDHRRCTLDVRPSRRRDPPQQLPARRDVRDRTAADARAWAEARGFREPRRGRGVRSRPDRGGAGGTDDAGRAGQARVRVRPPEHRAGRARPADAGAERRGGRRSRAVRERRTVVPGSELRPVRPVLDRAGRRRQRLVDARPRTSRNCSTTRRTTTSSETCIASPASI